MQVVEFGDVDLTGSLMLVGLPSQGLVGSIAASYLVETLAMQDVGAIDAEEFPPTVSVRKGVGYGIVSMHASELVCGLDGKCDRLVVLKADIPLPPELFHGIASALLDWAEIKAIDTIVSLEGFHAEGEEEVGVLGVASRAAEALLERFDIEPVQDVILSGFGSALIVAANRKRRKAIGLFTKAKAEVADARAAARLIEAVDPMLPNLRLEAAPLLQKAEALELSLSKKGDEARESMKKLSEHRTPMYL